MREDVWGPSFDDAALRACKKVAEKLGRVREQRFPTEERLREIRSELAKIELAEIADLMRFADSASTSTTFEFAAGSGEFKYRVSKSNTQSWRSSELAKEGGRLLRAPTPVPQAIRYS